MVKGVPMIERVVKSRIALFQGAAESVATASVGSDGL
jgi:hypothetical protein